MTRRVGKFERATEWNPAEHEGEFVEMQVGRTGIPDGLSSWERENFEWWGGWVAANGGGEVEDESVGEVQDRDGATRRVTVDVKRRLTDAFGRFGIWNEFLNATGGGVEIRLLVDGAQGTASARSVGEEKTRGREKERNGEVDWAWSDSRMGGRRTRERENGGRGERSTLNARVVRVGEILE